MMISSRLKPPIAPVLAFVLALALFFRLQLGNGFTLLFSDRYDGFIAISIVEHWTNVLLGTAPWSETGYFYNNSLTLAYNDGYLLYGVIHALFRGLGCDILLSAELVNVVMRGIGFVAFYLCGRRLLTLSPVWASFAALLFTISNSMYLHMVHQQLLTVSLVPLAAVLLDLTLAALREGRRRALLGWGAATAILIALWLLTAFYMVWFLLLFLLVFAAIWLLLAGSAARRDLMKALSRQALPLAALALFLALVTLPFFRLYLPKAAETGMHGYQTAMAFSPSPLDLLNIGDHNLLYGRLNQALRTATRPELPPFSEQTTGFPYGLLLSFVAALLSWRDKPLFLRVLGWSSVACWLLLAHFGPLTLYGLVHASVPGAKAVRVLSRFQLFLAAPLTALVVVWLAQRAGSWPRLALLAFCAILVLEEINLDGVIRIDRPLELARLEAIGRPPAKCRSFYVSVAREGDYNGPAIDGLYSHSADAMLIANWSGLPTLNGFSTFLPPGYDLFYPDRPDYPERVRHYAGAHFIASPCALDLKTMRWSRP